MEKTLEHYGVKGMRWGVRKDRKTSSDYRKSRSLKKKRLDEMSNEELRTLNKRLDLEKKYKQLNPSLLDQGQKIVSNMMKSLANKVVNQAFDQVASQAVGKLFEARED